MRLPTRDELGALPSLAFSAVLVGLVLFALIRFVIIAGEGFLNDEPSPVTHTGHKHGQGSPHNYPTKLDGSVSTEFEADDYSRALDASDAVKDYCSGAVSEAQRLGCESHVTEVP